MDNPIPQLEACMEPAYLRIVQDQVCIVASSDQCGPGQAYGAFRPALLDLGLDQAHVVRVRLPLVLAFANTR
jgi:hypothetical protein